MDDTNAQNNSENDESDRRICHRTSYARNLLLILASGKRLEGLSTDISLTGVAMQVSTIPAHIHMGQIGELFLVVDGHEPSTGFPCTIVHIGGPNKGKYSIGIEIAKESASLFGISLTKNLFKRKSSQV